MIRSLVFIIAVMAAVGWPSLAMPFRGDQALFAVVAEELSRGAVLYRDYWDITNPGVFWFYQAAGTLFGFTEGGVRLAEWLWVTAFVLTVSEAVRRSSSGRRLSLTPTFFVGVPYYLAGYANTSALTKTEGLVGFPLFAAVWLAARACDGSVRASPRLVAAGFAGGVVVLFKLMLAGVLGVAWLSLAVAFVRSRRGGVGSAAAFAATLGAGLLLALAPAAGYFAAHDTLREVVRTLVEMPPRFLAEGERAGPDRMAESVRWFLGQYAPVLAVAVVAAVARVRASWDPAIVAFALALPACFAAIVAQRLSWWSYHFVLPGTVAGVVASLGWPAVARAVHDRLGRPLTWGEWATAVAAAGMLVLEPAGGLAYLSLRLAGHDSGLTARGRREFREATGTAYKLALRETAWLGEPGAEPGPILVCGDPLFYWHSGRPPAVRVSGWSLQMYPGETRRELAEDVRTKRPVYVYVATRPEAYDSLIAGRYPQLAEVLRDDYVVLRRSADGVWYARRAAPPG